MHDASDPMDQTELTEQTRSAGAAQPPGGGQLPAGTGETAPAPVLATEAPQAPTPAAGGDSLPQMPAPAAVDEAPAADAPVTAQAQTGDAAPPPAADGAAAPVTAAPGADTVQDAGGAAAQGIAPGGGAEGAVQDAAAAAAQDGAPGGLPTMDGLPADAGAAETLRHAADRLVDFLNIGGPLLWTLAVLSVITIAVILWKVMRLASLGAWSGGRRTAAAIALWDQGRLDEAIASLANRRSIRAQLARAAMQAAANPAFDRDSAEAETDRVARGLLAQARSGLRALELAVSIGPLIGLMGTVTGMIASFHALQAAGSRADPATLAGGIWEALLTTAAGMGVAIPASIAVVWFDSIVDRLRHDMEDNAIRILHGGKAAPLFREGREILRKEDAA
ncbi:MotA/TolQ/ExbB proton channel family protein [Ruixingdingia sedimenti]|uniref:MotA/TolQ/ExbB proton channel family protein n=1 Tax=Ruixingdingia sedimenti TaxID=3073604 RepID=A0ABU1F2G9_9RHOB|nr:MotA/TolQ/ExbB proton channel family protein [Xinfangfangia sp. LG-4]MDR5651055.1 MotA/TolQ/ExbB proton channel family protein [Xinfangfangia sp. LG-4]